MVAALKSGEIDAAHDVPNSAVPGARDTKGIVAVQGEQGGFDELALNSYAGKPPRDTSKFDAPHPALLDPNVPAGDRARDRQADARRPRVLAGIGTPARRMSPSASPAWIPEIPEERAIRRSISTKAKQHPRRGRATRTRTGTASARCRAAEGHRHCATSSAPSPSTRSRRRVHHRLAEGDRHRHADLDVRRTSSTRRSARATTTSSCGAGRRSSTPIPMLSYFQCDQVIGGRSRTSPTTTTTPTYCDPGRTTSCTSSRTSSSTPRSAQEIVHEMLTRFYSTAGLQRRSGTSPDLQAYRTDRFRAGCTSPPRSGRCSSRTRRRRTRT